MQTWEQTEEQEQHRCEADWEWTHQKQAATHDAYRAGNQLRMAARRALERIGMFEGLAGFLDMSFQTTIYIFGACMCDRLLDVCGHMPGAAAALSSRVLLPHTIQILNQ